MATLNDYFRVEKTFTETQQDELLTYFGEIDSKLGGILFKSGVRICFKKKISSFYGLYTHNTKVITIYYNESISHAKFTLLHECVHALSHAYYNRDHKHDNWFWFTFGQLATIMGIPIKKDFVHKVED